MSPVPTPSKPTKTRRARGEGSFRLRSDGRWQYHLPADSEHPEKTVYGKTKSESAAKMRDWLREYSDAPAEVVEECDETPTVAAFFRQWFTNVVEPDAEAPGTVKSVRYQIENFIIPGLTLHNADGTVEQTGLGDMLLTAVEPRHVASLFRAMNQPHPRYPDRSWYSKSLMSHVKSTLTSGYTYAIFNRAATFNPAASVKIPKRAFIGQGKSLTGEQCTALLEALDGHRLEILFKVALSLGLRPGEVIALCWDVIDFNEGTIFIRRFVRRDGQAKILVDDVKNHKPRLLEAPDVVLELLREQRREQAELRMQFADRWDGRYPLVFTNFGNNESGLTLGGIIDHGSLNRSFKALCTKAGIPDPRSWHPNHLRHTFVSLMSRIGKVSNKEIAFMAGHHPDMTAGVYDHAIQPTIVGVGKMSEILANLPAAQSDSEGCA